MLESIRNEGGRTGVEVVGLGEGHPSPGLSFLICIIRALYQRRWALCPPATQPGVGVGRRGGQLAAQLRPKTSERAPDIGNCGTTALSIADKLVNVETLLSGFVCKKQLPKKKSGFQAESQD